VEQVYHQGEEGEEDIVSCAAAPLPLPAGSLTFYGPDVKVP